MQYEIREVSGLSPDMTPRQKRTLMSAAGEQLAKEMLSSVTGVPPENLTIVRDRGGKPHLLGQDLHFNISHSGNRVLCAVHTSPIGVDIEQPGCYRDRVARRVCTPEEYAYINGDPVRFLEVWTRKEAYAKLTGRGLALKLKSVAVAGSDGLLPEIHGAYVFTAQQDGYVFSIVYTAT